MIRRGEVELRREGRRAYVRMEGPEYVSDEELLRQAVAREDELQRTVRELEQSLSEWQSWASQVERERDAAKEAAAAANRPYHELESKYREEVAEHKETKEALIAARVGALVFLLLLVGWVLLWWFVLRYGPTGGVDAGG
jgi:CHASE3 domain sensor protein